MNIKKINKIKSLEDNWDNQGAKSPSALSIDKLIFISKILEKNSLIPNRIIPDVNGGISIYFLYGKKLSNLCHKYHASINIDNYGVFDVEILNNENKNIKEFNTNSISCLHEACKAIKKSIDDNKNDQARSSNFPKIV